MYELREFEEKIKEQRQERDSLRKALEDGRLHPVAMKLPKMVDRHRSESNSCSTSTKIILLIISLSLVAMFCYAVWRIRVIEEPSESNDYDYRMIGTEDLEDDATADDVNAT